MGLLLQEGALVGARGRSNHTPLHLAALYGYTDVMKQLFSKGASVEAIDENNNTPLHLAVLCVGYSISTA